MNRSKFRLLPRLLGIAIAFLIFLTSCGIQPGVARDRVFLDLSLDFLGEYQLPKMKFKDTPVGGLSGLTYDRQQNRFYAISDDRGTFAPARFYTLKLILNDDSDRQISLQKVEVEDVTFLTDEQGKTYPKGTLDTEGIAITPQKSIFIASEGIPPNGVSPVVGEFDLETGRLRQTLPIPERYLVDATKSNKDATTGTQNNLGFESLTLSPFGTIPAKGEAIRLFTATESSLMQDKEPANSSQGAKCRLLHYLITDGPPLVIAEHLYQMEPPPSAALKDGLAELLAVDTGGHFLSLERSLSLLGFSVRIYQAATGGATDISRVPSLKGEVSGINPVKKKLLLNLDELGVALANFEGMTFGPRLPDGSQSLLLVSDDNFQAEQVTKFFLFRLKNGR